MTKSELIARLAERFPQLVAKDADFAVKMILDAMTDALARGDRIEIRGFGSFALNYRPPRIGRNPKSGEKVRCRPSRCRTSRPARNCANGSTSRSERRVRRIAVDSGQWTSLPLFHCAIHDHDALTWAIRLVIFSFLLVFAHRATPNRSTLRFILDYGLAGAAGHRRCWLSSPAARCSGCCRWSACIFRQRREIARLKREAAKPPRAGRPCPDLPPLA